MWKDFFYFSRREKRGVIVLIVLIILVIGVNELPFGWFKESGEVNEEEHLQAAHEESKPLLQREEAEIGQAASVESEREIVLVRFDPNTADSLLFLQLGLSPRTARNALSYRRKGGKFRTPQDFRKIYGLTGEQYEQLAPYIYIPETVAPLRKTPPLTASPKITKDTTVYKKAFKYPSGTMLGLNEADTTELKKIPGIGSVTARRIVNYRRRLGGFYGIEQLSEIDLDVEQFAEWFTVSSDSIRLLNLNRISVERLKAHPYFNFYQAKVIVEHRKKRGALQALDVFSFYEEFTERDLERMKHYVCFD